MKLVSMPRESGSGRRRYTGRCNGRRPGADLADMAGGEDEEMTCRELVELVTDYLEGVLPAADRVLLDAHLEDCPYCTDYIAQMRQTVEALGELPADTIDPARHRELLEAFRGWRD